MRVISGIYKRRMFNVPKSFKARPTTDFAKENLFNVLVNNYLDFDNGNIVALDLFAGTGSISIELVSRGCKEVISIEKDRDHLSFIKDCLNKLKTDKCTAIQGDAFKFIQRCHQKFNFIFADPPYKLPKMEFIPQLIFDANILEENGILVFEHGKDHNYSEHPYFLEQREYGSVHFSFFRQQ